MNLQNISKYVKAPMRLADTNDIDFLVELEHLCFDVAAYPTRRILSY